MWLQAEAGNRVGCSTRGALVSTRVLLREETQKEFCLSSRCRCVLITGKNAVKVYLSKLYFFCSNPQLFPRYS